MALKAHTHTRALSVQNGFVLRWIECVSFRIKVALFAPPCFMSAAVPLDISEFSVRPPHRDRVTSGRSPAESERHSVPLSAAALPTDCGD